MNLLGPPFRSRAQLPFGAYLTDSRPLPSAFELTYLNNGGGSVRTFAKQILVSILLASFIDLPAGAVTNPGSASKPGGGSAASASTDSKPVGLVIQAQSAILDNSEAAIGTTIYAGDELETQAGGILRLRVGSGQFYMLASSAATLVQTGRVPQVHLLRGTVGISAPGPNQLELDTPLGVVRANDGPAYGQVRIVSPDEIVVSSFHGSLTIDYDGDVHSIEAGKSYAVTLEPETQDNKVVAYKDRRKRRRLVLALIFLGGETIAGIILWQNLTESCSNFPGH